MLSAEFLDSFHRFYLTAIQEIVVRRYEPSIVGLIQDRDDPFFEVLIENLLVLSVSVHGPGRTLVFYSYPPFNHPGRYIQYNFAGATRVIKPGTYVTFGDLANTYS